MSQLPPVVWLVIAAFAGLLIALGVVTSVTVLRMARRRWAQWPTRYILGLLLAAALPWLVVWLAPLRVAANINGTLELIGWLLVTVVVFAILVLLPLAALMTAVIWWQARRRQGTRVSPPT